MTFWTAYWITLGCVLEDGPFYLTDASAETTARKIINELEEATPAAIEGLNGDSNPTPDQV